MSLAAVAAAVIGESGLSSGSMYLLIAVTAAPMGLRNAVVRKLAVADLTTTVLTLTVTGLAADSGLAGGTSPREGRRMLAILTMTGGALAGTLLLRTFGMWISFVVAAFVVGAIGVYLYMSERSRSARIAHVTTQTDLRTGRLVSIGTSAPSEIGVQPILPFARL